MLPSAAEMLEARVQNPNPRRIDQLADALHDVVPADRPQQQQQEEQEEQEQEQQPAASDAQQEQEVHAAVASADEPE